MSFNGTHHVMVKVGDIDVAKHFYGKILGLEEAECPVDDGQRVWYQVGPQQLHVNMQKEYYKAGFGHFAISLSPGDYHKYAERIKASAYEKQHPSQKFVDGLHRLFIDDPFGNTIEMTDGQIDV